ncbi:MAG: hypothetical protein QOF78_246 [Phycisphaerales bacterium]|jgi:hypothetical protein|nr:hypothetical protein [Phycisphaerales bacterium]
MSLVQVIGTFNDATLAERARSRLARAGLAEEISASGNRVAVEVPEERVEPVRTVLAEEGAVDVRKRVRRLDAAVSPETDPSPIAYAEEEIPLDRPCIDTSDDAVDAAADGNGKVRLFDEATFIEIGRITEGELKVLQDAFEEEDLDDNDYWINPDEIDDLACRPGATKHLIALLRRAVGDNPDGIDIAFQREGQPRQSLRHNAGAI